MSVLERYATVVGFSGAAFGGLAYFVTGHGALEGLGSGLYAAGFVVALSDRFGRRGTLRR